MSISRRFPCRRVGTTALQVCVTIKSMPKRKGAQKKKAGFIGAAVGVAQLILGGIGIAAAVKTLGGGLKRPPVRGRGRGRARAKRRRRR